ncbi:MAG: HPr(Ser) kinase/phosphatase [Deltaproteobacteria bacterium]|nr:HPr(Ser) kinase/phosphatase [Deltaproteobacteria bacterium]
MNKTDRNIVNITVDELLKETAERFGFRLAGGKKGLLNKVTTSRIQKPGLLLTGLKEQLHPERIQIFGKAEIEYLNGLTSDRLKETLKRLKKAATPCFIITKKQNLPVFLFRLAEEKNIPLLTTHLTTSLFIERFTKYLEERLAPTTTIHGVFVDVLGVGVLILGKSGIGKSECALDLITKGYRLIADDAVIIKRISPTTLFGIASDIIKYHMEVRGLGIVNVKDLFGITAIREKKQMDVVVELAQWGHDEEYDRLGFEEGVYEILGVKLPFHRIPVSPGRSVATIVEIAARNQLLKIMGYHSALEFKKRLDMAVMQNKKGEGRP